MNLLIEKVTERARGVLELAERIARDFGESSIEPEHLLLALVAERKGLAAHVLENLGVDSEAAELACALCGMTVKPSESSPASSDALNQLQKLAQEEQFLDTPCSTIPPSASRAPSA